MIHEQPDEHKGDNVFRIVQETVLDSYAINHRLFRSPYIRLLRSVGRDQPGHQGYHCFAEVASIHGSRVHLAPPYSPTSPTLRSRGCTSSFFLCVIRRFHPAHQPARFIRVSCFMLPRHRHRKTMPLRIVPPHVCLREGETHVSIACGTMSHVVLLRWLQQTPLLRTDELEPAPDLRLLIPRHKPRRTAAHCNKNEDACPVINKPF